MFNKASKPADEIPHSKYATPEAEITARVELEKQKDAEADAMTEAFKPGFVRILAAWRAFDLTTWKPDGMVHEYAAGKFLCIGKIEVPLQYVETITAAPEKTNSARPMDEPKLVPAMAYDFGYEKPRWRSEKPRVVYPASTVITIGLSSGRTESFTCRREIGELQLAHLQHVWKHG